MTNLRTLLVTIATVSLLLLTACDMDTVADVRNDPSKFESKEAHLGGVVTKTLGVMGYGVYEIEDQTGKIFVVSQGRGVPGKGARVEVKGKSKSGFMFAGTDYGTVIVEASRKVRD